MQWWFLRNKIIILLSYSNSSKTITAVSKSLFNFHFLSMPNLHSLLWRTHPVKVNRLHAIMSHQPYISLYLFQSIDTHFETPTSQCKLFCQSQSLFHSIDTQVETHINLYNSMYSFHSKSFFVSFHWPILKHQICSIPPCSLNHTKSTKPTNHSVTHKPKSTKPSNDLQFCIFLSVHF